MGHRLRIASTGNSRDFSSHREHLDSRLPLRQCFEYLADEVRPHEVDRLIVITNCERRRSGRRCELSIKWIERERKSPAPRAA